MGGLRRDPHLYQRIADIPAEILTRIQRIHIHIACLVDRLVCLLAALILPEYIELYFRTEFHFDTLGTSCLHCFPQHIACVALERCSIGVDNIAEHAADSAVRGSPGNDRNGGGIRLQEEVAADVRVESGDRCSVDGNPIFHGPLQLP